MLKDIERRRILEQPARERLAPLQRLIGPRALFDIHLDKGPFFLRLLPRQRALTGRKPDNDIADTLGLTGLEHDVL